MLTLSTHLPKTLRKYFPFIKLYIDRNQLKT